MKYKILFINLTGCLLLVFGAFNRSYASSARENERIQVVDLYNYEVIPQHIVKALYSRPGMDIVSGVTTEEDEPCAANFQYENSLAFKAFDNQANYCNTLNEDSYLSCTQDNWNSLMHDLAVNEFMLDGCSSSNIVPI